MKKQFRGRNLNKVLSAVPFLRAISNEDTMNVVRAHTFSKIANSQLEMFKKSYKKRFKKKGKSFLGAHANKSVTKKPSEIRMGKGKGAINHYVFNVSPGFQLAQIHGVPSFRVSKFLRKLNKKSSVNFAVFTKLIFK